MFYTDPLAHLLEQFGRMDRWALGLQYMLESSQGR
jgi:hypothetical protein